MAFTGSGATGRRLLEYSARSNMKRCYLELGGKSPNVVFADAPDIATAAKVSVNGIFRNAGQVCVAGSRLLVQSSVYDRFMDELLKVTGKLKVGDPLNLETNVGAVASFDQLEKDLEFVAIAEREGAKRLTGGSRILEETGGSYMEPTVFADVTNDSLSAMTLTEVGRRRLPAPQLSTSIEAGTISDSDVDRDASDDASENTPDAESAEEAMSTMPFAFKRIVLRLQWNDASGSPVEPIELVAWKHEAGAGQGKEAARP